MHDRTMRPPPLNHAVFGNGRLLGLVSPTSAIEWLCLPRFDSPSVFGRLLDHEQGGSFRILHASGELDLDSAKIGGLSFEQIVSGLEAVAKERGEVELTETVNDEPAVCV